MSGFARNIVLWVNGASAVKKSRNGALAADFFEFGSDDFPCKLPVKKCSKTIVFPLWRRDPSRFWSCKSLQFVEPSCVVFFFAVDVVHPWEERAVVLLTFMVAFLRAQSM